MDESVLILSVFYYLILTMRFLMCYSVVGRHIFVVCNFALGVLLADDKYFYGADSMWRCSVSCESNQE